MMVPPATVSLMASRALSRCAMHHITSRPAVIGIGQRMASSHRFAPLTFLLHSLSSSSSSPRSSRGGLARLFSGGRSAPSGHAGGSKASRTPIASVLASDTAHHNREKQLADLKGEIDAVTSEIRAEKASWKKANAKYKPVYQKSIDVLNEALKGLRDHRRELSLASIAAQVPAPGKSTPLCVCCALCCRRPPLCVHMRLTSAPLACNYCLLRSFPPPPSRRPLLLLRPSSCPQRN